MADSRGIPRVSIGLPVYNGERYLRESIDSILAQTFQDFELVVCDNASTDETARICEEYAERDPRVRYFRNARNIGGINNANLTFERSRGDLFRWAAHDDVCAPVLLERCVQVAGGFEQAGAGERHQVDAVWRPALRRFLLGGCHVSPGGDQIVLVDRDERTQAFGWQVPADLHLLDDP